MQNATDLSFISGWRQRNCGIDTGQVIKSSLALQKPEQNGKADGVGKVDFPVAHLGSGGGEVEIWCSRDDVIGEDGG